MSHSIRRAPARFDARTNERTNDDAPIDLCAIFYHAPLRARRVLRAHARGERVVRLHRRVRTAVERDETQRARLGSARHHGGITLAQRSIRDDVRWR